jgi:hypothetical protein
MIGPIGQTFDFSDSWGGRYSAPQLFWLAREFDDSRVMQEEREFTRENPDERDIFHLLYYDSGCAAGPARPLPPNAIFRGTSSLAFIRTAWSDFNAFYVGFKAGTPVYDHGHLDIGSFVLDAQGRRWATELGSEAYIKGYFGPDRGSFYRASTEGHNTVTISDRAQTPFAAENQLWNHESKITAFRTQPTYSLAVANLSSVYHPRLVISAYRGVALVNGNQFIVQDEVVAPKPVEILWNFHTYAAVTIEGDRASLKIDDKEMLVEIVEPRGARFETRPTNPRTVRPSSEESMNEGISNLVARLPSFVQSATITVRVFPKGTKMPPLKTNALSDWARSGPISSPPLRRHRAVRDRRLPW